LKTIDYSNLINFCTSALNSAGLDDFSCSAVTTGLCETSLRGVDSHGVRLLPHYINSALNGRKNPKPKYKYKQIFPSIAHLDADNAFGHAAGMKAIDFGMEMAKKQGIGAVSVSNSSHPGAMASMALRAARSGYIAFAFTHADALVLSHNGKRPYFGTNPICMAAPRLEKEPYCLDMASSTIPWNRVIMHRNSKQPLATGVAADSDGNLTTDPESASCLMPAGGYKGYGIASMVETLCGIYTGMAFGRDIPAMFKAPIDKPRKLGQFYIVMRTDGVVSADEFIKRMQQMTDEVRSEPRINDDPVMLPGDPEILESNYRKKHGIPLDDNTISEFVNISNKFNIELKLK
jgi:ureidoglycolate dehydrogenase (NAD+)